MAKKPVSGTKEWADGSANIQRGCEHNCLYCYARATDSDPSTWNTVKVRGLQERKGRPNRIMFPTRHDITPLNISSVIEALPTLLEQADNLLIVTKPHYGCVMEMCEFLLDHAINGPGPKPCMLSEAVKEMQRRVMFRFTIGSMDNSTLRYWEPGAPVYEERLASLVHAHHMGFQTSVSCEPAIEHPEYYFDLVAALEPYVTDAIWIGRMNNVQQRLMTNSTCDDVLKEGILLEGKWNTEACHRIYNQLKGIPKVKWKDSIKEIVGLDRPTTPGADR